MWKYSKAHEDLPQSNIQKWQDNRNLVFLVSFHSQKKMIIKALYDLYWILGMIIYIYWNGYQIVYFKTKLWKHIKVVQDILHRNIRQSQSITSTCTVYLFNEQYLWILTHQSWLQCCIKIKTFTTNRIKSLISWWLSFNCMVKLSNYFVAVITTLKQ